MELKLPELNLPAQKLKVRRCSDGTVQIFDAFRCKWVALTPEEWVRQNFSSWLCNEKKYVPSFMANEIGISLNGTRRRCDTVVFDSNLKPLMIVEYKAPSVSITQPVFDQIARYNIVLNAPYLTVSNGLSHYCCRYSGGSYAFLREIPDYDALVGMSMKK